MTNEVDDVELGLDCADVRAALDRGLNGKRLSELSSSLCEVVNQSLRCVSQHRSIVWMPC